MPRPARQLSPKNAPASKSSPEAVVHPIRAESRSALLTYGQSVLDAEARAILSVRERLGEHFVRAVELILACPGKVIVTGIGKPGFLAQKLSAVLASTGTPSLYLHPAEAVHGDLGRVAADDVVLALSNSGTTEEIVRLLPFFRRVGAKVIAITADRQTPLAKGADLALEFGQVDEACPMGLVPTASAAVLHAVGDALAMTLVKQRQFTTEAYARLHPGGTLGRSVMRVFEVMRSGAANPTVRDTASLSEAVVVMTNTPGRPGAASVVDRHGKLVGIFTDGDLRRLVERGHSNFHIRIKDVMGKHPRCIAPEELVLTAASQMREFRVDQLPVVNAEGRPIGLLDVQDLLAARFV